MDRLISEQAVIESIEFFQMNPQHFDFVNLIDDIKDIPSAEPRWIPVSERLPEWGEEVLTINNDGNYEINHIIDDERNEWFNDDDIVAWQPLPQPYKAESEG